MALSFNYSGFLAAIATGIFLLPANLQAEPVLVELKFKGILGEPGEALGQFNNPRSIDKLTDGRIVVFEQSRIQICDLEGICSAFGSRGTGPGEFALYGRDIGVDSQDRIVVTDTDNWRIQVCTEHGDCNVFGRESDEWPDFKQIGTFYNPNTVNVDRNDQIWIGSTSYHRVQICDFDGNCRAYGEPIELCDSQGCIESSVYNDSGYMPGGLGFLHVDNHDRVFLNWQNKIQVCDQSDVPKCTEFKPAINMDGLVDLNSFSLDSDDDGLLFIADSSNSRIHNCNIETEQCRTAGSKGDGPGQFLSLSDISVRSDGLVISAESIFSRVQLFSITQPGAFHIHAGLNDAWYNPDTDGQGFFINVFQEHGIVFLSWFTYETSARDELAPDAIVGERFHRWLTAQGPFEGNFATLDVTMTSDGIFADQKEIVNSEPGEYGTISIEFHDCSNATLTYDLHAVDEAGVIPITRIVPDNARVCEIMDFQ